MSIVSAKQMHMGHQMNMTNGSFEQYYKNEDVDDVLRWPKRVNVYGNIFLIIYAVLFNIGFWWICINEYVQPATNYIKNATESETEQEIFKV